MNYEKGLISTDVFITSFTKKFPMISNKEFTTAWNSIILDFPEHRLTFIEHLASLKKYKLILLSNTNELHIEGLTKKFKSIKRRPTQQPTLHYFGH